MSLFCIPSLAWIALYCIEVEFQLHRALSAPILHWCKNNLHWYERTKCVGKNQLPCQVYSRAVAMLPDPNSEVCQISRNICLISDARQILRRNIWPPLVLNIYPSLRTVDFGDGFWGICSACTICYTADQFNHILGSWQHPMIKIINWFQKYLGNFFWQSILSVLYLIISKVLRRTKLYWNNLVWKICQFSQFNLCGSNW